MRNLGPMQRALELHERGVPTAAIASRLGVSSRQAARFLKYAREIKAGEVGEGRNGSDVASEDSFVLANGR